MESSNKGFSTKLIHSGGHKDQYGSPIVPIYQTSTFAFDDAEQGAKIFSGDEEGYIYTRINNPTIRELEKTVAELENGYDGIATSSGMGAVNCVYFGLLSAGSHIVCQEVVYGPTRTVLENYFKKFGVESSFIDATDIENIRKAIKTNTKLVFIETPANPTMDIIDIKAAAEVAHSKNVPLVVDNTFCSPFLQNPINLGADIVVHSMTKFINGHADIVAGMIVTNDRYYYNLLRPVMVTMGCNMDSNQAFLVRRGLKTLAIRMEKAQSNAMQIAEYLEKHPKIDWVKYPGLKSHPKYEFAKQQMKGPGAILSIGLKGGCNAGKILMNNVKVFLLAVSLGGVESLIQHPASMTHSKVPKEERLKVGITDELVRISVGIEDVSDLISDLSQALEKI
jgi:methionine-gamma-lyase